MGLLIIYGLGKVKNSPVEVYLLMNGLVKAVLLWVWVHSLCCCVNSEVYLLGVD